MSTPLVSDEQIYKRVDEYTLPYRTEITRVTKEFRDIYESELQSMRDRLSRMEEAGKHMRDHLEILSEGWEADGAFNAAKYPSSLVENWDAALSNK